MTHSTESKAIGLLRNCLNYIGFLDVKHTSGRTICVPTFPLPTVTVNCESVKNKFHSVYQHYVGTSIPFCMAGFTAKTHKVGYAGSADLTLLSLFLQLFNALSFVSTTCTGVARNG